MFGKDYDKEISLIHKRISDIVESNNKNNEIIIKMIKDNQEINQQSLDSIKKTFLNVTNVMSSHKKAIELLSKR